MSQPQMQHKPSTVNGLNRRRGDRERDLGNRSENFRNDYHKYRPFRQGSSTMAATEGLGSGQHLSSSSSDNISQIVASSAKSSGDKAEMLTPGENRDGSQRPTQGLLLLTACLVGQPVEVQVKNGSIYSGVFHTASAEKDYGIVLRMARLVRDGLSKGVCGDGGKELARRPIQSLVINADELVQIIAKEVPVSGECLQNGRCRENRTEIVTDSFISQGRHGEKERELKPWTPDGDDPRELALETTFQNTWNRNWDQFEINKALFGVESTFDEELYTTKLERGPQMREREREAWRIAREIEGENTKNLHLAEERGGGLSKDIDQLDEESRYSSVLRTVDDIGEDNDDSNIDLQNDVTFGQGPADTDVDITSSAREHASNITDEPDRNLLNKHTELHEPNHGLDKDSQAKESASSSVDSHVSSVDIAVPKEKVAQITDWSKRGIKVGSLPSPLVSPLIADTTSIQALNLDPGCPQVTEDVYREFNEFKLQESAKRGKKQREDQVNELKSFSESLKDLTPRQANVGSSRKMNASACAPPASALPIPTNIAHTVSANSSSESVSSHNSVESAKAHDGSQSLSEFASTSGTQSSLLNAETRITSLTAPLATTLSSPSSSGISNTADSSKKSTLNPNAKEFKLNPNAKSFTPSFTPLRPPSPVVQGPVYVQGVVPPVAPVQAFPVNPLLQPPGQPGTKYPPYSPAATPYMPTPGSYAPVTGTTVPSAIGAAGQTPVKVMPQIQPPAGGHSFASSQQPVRYSSQSSPVQPTSTYIHPSGPLYSQQMLFGQPGPVVYLQPYIQGPPLPPPQPVPTTGQQQQPKHRGPVF